MSSTYIMKIIGKRIWIKYIEGRVFLPFASLTSQIYIHSYYPNPIILELFSSLASVMSHALCKKKQTQFNTYETDKLENVPTFIVYFDSIFENVMVYNHTDF